MIKICLAANSGGHLNELLQLDKFTSQYICFFITDRSSFSEELAQNKKLFFVEKFIMRECIRKGQLVKPLRNLWQSFSIIRREQPDIVITTGAGAAFGSCVAAKLFRKKVIFIESIARVGEPSSFGKMITCIANATFVQWESMLKYYKGAIYAGSIFSLNGTTVEDKVNSLIFVTAGTYDLQFNRVLIELDRLKENGFLTHEVVAQIGRSTYRPKHYETFDYGPQTKIHKLIDLSDFVICHGGSGSIMDSLMRGKRVIAVPRLKLFDEFFDDHQLQFVQELERAGVIIAVYDISHLGNAIKKVQTFQPNFKDICNRIDGLLNQFIADNLGAKLP